MTYLMIIYKVYKKKNIWILASRYKKSLIYKYKDKIRLNIRV